MTAPDARLALADELEQYAVKQRINWSCALPSISWDNLETIVTALRAHSQPGNDLSREAVARIIDPNAFTNAVYRDRYPDRATLDGYEAFKKADAILSFTPPASGMREATRAQHFDVPKGQPARFVRNGVLETCQCRECAALSALPVKGPDEVARCEVCDWPLASDQSKGCIPGDCSYRPDEPAEQERIRKRRAALSADNHTNSNAEPANHGTDESRLTPYGAYPATVGDDRESMGSEPAKGIVTGGSDPTPLGAHPLEGPGTGTGRPACLPTGWTQEHAAKAAWMINTLAITPTDEWRSKVELYDTMAEFRALAPSRNTGEAGR